MFLDENAQYLTPREIFDHCIQGVDHQNGVLVYNVSCVVSTIALRDAMTSDEAWTCFEHISDAQYPGAPRFIQPYIPEGGE